MLVTGVIGFVVLLATMALPRPYAPVFDVEGFERALVDTFWIGIDDRDPAFDPARVERDLGELKPLFVGCARGRTP